MALLVAPALSALADRRGWRVRLLSLALAGTALGLLALPLAGSFSALLPLVAVLAVACSPLGPLADGLLARMAARRGLAYGRMRLWGSLSFAIVAAAGGALWQQLGFAAMFPVASLLFAAMIPVVHLLDEDPPISARARLPLREATRGPDSALCWPPPCCWA